MPRRVANDGISLLSGEHENVLVNFEGRVRLASRNRFPNGDLDDDGPLEGSLDEWPDLGCPPQVVGWFPYYSDVAGRPFWRQTFEGVNVRESEWTLDDPWLRIAVAPDITYQGRVGAPGSFEVDLVELERIGFGAGNYWVGLNYGVGNPWLARHLLRWTDIGQWVQVNIPEDGMGMEILLPERPEGITFYGIFVSRRNQPPTTARLQEVAGVTFGARDSIKLREPWKNGHPPPAVNRTFIGALGQMPPPLVILSNRLKVRSARGINVYKAHGGTQGGYFQFRALAKTEFGWTLPGQPTRPIWAGNGWLSCAYWCKARPIPNIKIEQYAIEVRGRKLDSNQWSDWQRLGTKHGRTEFAFSVFVPVYAWSQDKMVGDWVLESSQGGGEDASGIPKPESALETPRTISGAPLGPGRKFVKATWSYYEEDEVGRVEERESAPSPMVTVDVPGIGGAATHTIKFHRPPGMNEEYNPTFVNLKQDQQEIDWIRDPAGPSGAGHFPQVGYTEVVDTTNRTTNEIVYYSRPVDVRDEAERAIRMTVELDEETYASGGTSVQIEFLNASQGLLGAQAISWHYGAGRDYVHTTIGPPGSDAEIQWPIGTAFYRRRFNHHGSSPLHGPRNFTARYKDIGAFPGLAHPLKRFNVIEEAQADAEDYPPNAYISVLSRDLIDEERIRPVQNLSPWVREVIDFESGIPADVTVGGGGSVTLDFARPISGAQSLRCDAPTSQQAFVRQDAGANRSTLNPVCKLRLDKAPTTASSRIMDVLDGQVIASFLARNDNRIQCQSYPTGAQTTVLDGDKFPLSQILELNLSIGVEGAGTSNATIKFYVSRGSGRRQLVATHSGINMTNLFPRYTRAGVLDGTNHGGMTVTVDELEVYERDEWEEVPGRMAEYWAAAGTPKHASNGIRGARVLVTPGATEILSAFVEFRGWRAAASVLGYSLKNKAGEVIERFAPLVSGRRFRRMRRYWRVHAWPEDAAYVEFDTNDLGEGLVRWAAFQLEDMTPDGRPTPFTNEHVADGWIEVPFHTRVPGVPKGSEIDVYNRIAAWQGGEARGDTPENTSIAASFATSDEAGQTWSPYAENLLSLDVAERVKARARLHTDDLEVTPELTEIVVDFVRKGPVVLRGDCTEIPGGAVPLDFPAIQEDPNVVQEQYADGSRGFTSYGERPLVANGWRIEAYYDEGVLALSKEIGREDSILVVEELGGRHHLQVLNLPIPPPDRLLNYPVKGRRNGGFQFVSEAVESDVISVEPLTAVEPLTEPQEVEA